MPITDVFKKRTYVHRLEKDCFYTICDLNELKWDTSPGLFYINPASLEHSEILPESPDSDWLAEEELSKIVEE